MAFLTFQRQGQGRYTSVYATAVTWGDIGHGKRGALQKRIYLGRLDSTGKKLRVTKGEAGGMDIEVDIDDVKKRVAGGEDIRAWFRILVAQRQNIAVPITGCADAVIGERGTAVIGQLHVLRSLALSLGLESVLCGAFGRQRGLALLLIAVHQAVRAEPLYLAEAWFSDVWLPDEVSRWDFSSPGTSRLMEHIGRDAAGQQVFYERWIETCGKPTALIYDTTSISTYAEHLETVGFGYNRDAEKLPQVNLALVCSRDPALPLFTRLLPGSVPDVTTSTMLK